MANKRGMATKSRLKVVEEEGKGGARYGGDATGLVTFLVGTGIVAFLFWTNPLWPSFDSYNFVNTGLCLWLPLLVILLFLKQDPTHFGLTRGDRKLGMRWVLISIAFMLLPLIYVSNLPAFRHQYLMERLSQPLALVGPVFDGTRAHLPALLYYELGMGFYMFCWEFFFRGFLLFGLQKTWLKTWGAVIVQALPFMLLHWSWMPLAAKPPIETLSALPGGIILGILAIRTRSFFYGFLIHWGISLLLDLLLLGPFIFHKIG
jgi:membrane protease YdiL (CAAX protease family)